MQIFLFQKKIPLRTCSKQFTLDVDHDLIQFGPEMYHERRKIIPVAQKSALCLSVIATTQQGRRKMLCQQKPGGGSWFECGGKTR